MNCICRNIGELGPGKLLQGVVFMPGQKVMKRTIYRRRLRRGTAAPSLRLAERKAKEEEGGAQDRPRSDQDGLSGASGGPLGGLLGASWGFRGGCHN